jgi:hypothetical protein
MVCDILSDCAVGFESLIKAVLMEMYVYQARISMRLFDQGN